MIGCGASEPATTHTDVNHPPRQPARTANQANRRRLFGGMEQMFGKAENPPSDAAGSVSESACPATGIDARPGCVDIRHRFCARRRGDASFHM